jgi:hypothetical protein
VGVQETANIKNDPPARRPVGHKGTVVRGCPLRVLPELCRQCCWADGPTSARRLAPADDLEEEGAEDCDGRNREADGRVAGELADLAPAVGVQQHAAERRALEDGRDFIGELGVGGSGLCGGAELRIGLAAGDLIEMNVDEAVGIDLGLLTGEELLAGVLSHRRGIPRWADIARSSSRRPGAVWRR